MLKEIWAIVTVLGSCMSCLVKKVHTLSDLADRLHLKRQLYPPPCTLTKAKKISSDLMCYCLIVNLLFINDRWYNLTEITNPSLSTLNVIDYCKHQLGQAKEGLAVTRDNFSTTFFSKIVKMLLKSSVKNIFLQGSDDDWTHNWVNQTCIKQTLLVVMIFGLVFLTTQ